MAGSRKSIARLLDRHKTVLGREMDPTNSQVLAHLVKKGVLSPEEQHLLISERNYAVRGEMFVDLFSRKGFNAFREFCITLELECPHLLTSLLLDSTARIVLFGGTNLEEETYSSSTLQQHHQQQSPAFRSRPPPFPSPSRPRPRSVAPEFHRRSTNIDYSEDKAMTLSRSNLDRGPTQERCNYFDFRPSTSLDYVPTYQRSNFDYAPTYQRSNFDQSLEISNNLAETLGVAHSRENSIASVIFNMSSPKCNNRDLEMHRSPSANSILSNGATGTNSGGFQGSNSDLPTPPGLGKVKEKVPFEDVHELLEEPVEEQGGERIVWEYHNVILERVPGYGFGIAVSGGRDNPHFTNGDPSIAISDVLKAGPAEGKLLINDRVISANGISLEGVDYATAVQVLRDSGQTVSLVVKRRVVLPPTAHTATNNAMAAISESKSVRVTLSRNKKKEDFGVVLGCKIYIKEITGRTVADKDGSLQEGDLISKINGNNIDGLTLKEARSLIEKSKDKLELVVKRTGADKNIGRSANPHAGLNGDLPAKHNYAPQNLYVQPPIDEKNNLARAIYSSSAMNGADQLNDGPLSAPPRPPLPQEDDGPSMTSTPSTVAAGTASTEASGQDREARNQAVLQRNSQVLNESDYGTSSRPLASQSEDRESSERPQGNLPDPRFISFQKNGSVGIRLTGGNEVGIFVTAVQPGSPAAQQGLQPGDKILKVNDMDMKGVTREEAVLFLLSLQDQINLIAQYRRDEYDQIVSLQRGDSFYIKAHFNYEEPEKGEMALRKSDVFHVVDTLHNGVVGSWQVFRMDPFLSGLGRAAEQVQKGVIPNKARGEELATQQFNAAKKEQNSLEQSRGTSFFRRKRDKSAHHRRSKSLGKDHWEDLVWSESMSKFPAYERVSLRHPGFPRPVVIFGPCADLARERLLRDYPGKFAAPQLDPTDGLSTTGSGKNSSSGAAKSGIVRLSSIRDVMNRGKHALLDVTPNAVDKLNYAQFYPIVILAKADSKQTIKEIRAGVPKKAHLSSKKLLEQCQKLEKLWSHVFTTTLNLNNITAESQWYTKLTDLIDKQQTAPIWMSESKPDQSFADDFLFPMTSRMSYTSSPESDGEFCDPDNSMSRAASQNPSLSHDVTSGGLARSNSDPNLARDDQDEEGAVIPDYSSPPPYAVNTVQQSQTQPISNDVVDSSKRRGQGGDSKYGFSTSVRNSKSNSIDMYSSPPLEAAEDMPLPPPPGKTGMASASTNGNLNGTPNTSSSGSMSLQNNSSSSISKRSQSQPPNRISPPRTNGSEAPASLPNVPPKIDRQKKPSRRSGSSSNGGSGSNGEYLQTNGSSKGNSLERHSHIRDMKMSAYDPYDPYSTGNEVNGINGTDPSTTSTPGSGGSSRPRSMGGTSGFHDPASQSPGTRQSRAMSQDPGYRAGQSGRPLYANPPSTNGMNGYESSPSSKYSTPPSTVTNGVIDQQQRYRYADYKPVPPPKTASYKPVPPPKPKTYQPPPPPPATTTNGGQRGSVPMMGIQQSSSHQQQSSYVPEGNYMNSGPIHQQQQQSSSNGGYATSLHYHSSQMNYEPPSSLGHAPNYGPPPPTTNGRAYDDDSGQGSSLDRDYHTNNGYVDRNGGYGSTGKQPPPSVNHSRGQYYYNVPPGSATANGGANGSGPVPRRSGDGLDLSNREYRGSAFELYKKPMSEARSLPPNSQHYYNQHQIGR